MSVRRRVLTTLLIIVLATLASVYVSPKVFAHGRRPVGPHPTQTHWNWYGERGSVYPVLYVDASDVRKWKGFRTNAIVGLASPICNKIPKPPIPVVGAKLRGVAISGCYVLFQFYGWRVQDVMARAHDSGRCVKITVYSPYVFSTATTKCRWH